MKHKKLSPETIKNQYSAFVPLSKWCTKNFKELTEVDIFTFLDYLENHTYIKSGEEKHYSENTIHSYKIIYKKFFNSLDLPNVAKLFSEEAPERKKIDRNTLLTPEEADILINAATNFRDKAITAVLYETGSRRGELLSCRIKNVKFDLNGCLLTFPESKTGERTVRCIYSTSFLRSWIDNHPCRTEKGEPDPEAYLFVSLHMVWVTDKKTGELKQEYKRLSEQGIYAQIQRIAKHTKINKKVNPHAWRHAAASNLAEHLTDQQLKKYLGWSPDSVMCKTYIHDVDTEKAILKMNGVEIEEKPKDTLRAGKCPRCKDFNPDTSSYCGKCGHPLKETSMRQLEEETDTFETEFAQLIAKYPNLIENLAKYKKNE